MAPKPLAISSSTCFAVFGENSIRRDLMSSSVRGSANKQRYVKDPTTGKRLARPNAKDLWIIEEVLHLRIIDDNLWNKVPERLVGIRHSAFVRKARETRFWEHRRSMAC